MVLTVIDVYGLMHTNPHGLNSGFLIVKPHKQIEHIFKCIPNIVEFFEDYFADQRSISIYVTK